MTRTPRIAIAGMAIESSVYAAHRAGAQDFSVLTGPDLIDRYPFLAPGMPLRSAATWLPVLYARSLPGGAVQPEYYQEISGRIIAELAALHADRPLDAVYLDLHGAMSVVGMTDAEGDLVSRIREVIGPDVLVGAAMDLHGNISPRFFEQVDLPTCYRMAPHEDAWQTRERAARTLIAQWQDGRPPVRAWVPVPILLPGEKTSTRVEPARSLYAELAGVEALDGVIDASIWIGYAWADEPRCHASVIVTGSDRQVVRDQAERLARRLWSVREEFEFVGPPGTLDEAVQRALTSGERPYLISDSGDNPGAGGSGDVTWTLTRLLAMPELTGPGAPLTYVASIFDAEAVAALDGRQVGDEVQVVAGARVDHRVSPPVTIHGTVSALVPDTGRCGRAAVIAVGGLRVVITERRAAFHDVADFRALGLEPELADIIVTKIGYLEPTLYDLARGWTLALTPGPVDQDLVRLGHHRIARPMFPYDTVDADPDLSARVRG